MYPNICLNSLFSAISFRSSNIGYPTLVVDQSKDGWFLFRCLQDLSADNEAFHPSLNSKEPTFPQNIPRKCTKLTIPKKS